jgi:vacuolar-type H+-ATPase subunit H
MTVAATKEKARTIKISDAKLNKIIDDAFENSDFIYDALREKAQKIIQQWLKENRAEIEQRMMQVVAAKLPKKIGDIIDRLSDNVYFDY